MEKSFNESIWIENYFEKPINLNKIESIRNFSIFWNMFERFCCNRMVTLREIDNFVIKLNNKAPFVASHFADYLSYFQKRYLVSGATNSAFSGLKFRSGEQSNKIHVENVLLGVLVQPIDTVKAVLYIIYRLRNNFLHGEKNIAKIDEQVDNFNTANRFLSVILDLTKSHCLIPKSI